MRPVVDELMEHYAEWDNAAVLIVAHGGTISALTANLLEFGEHQYPLLKSIGNTNIARLQAMPRYRVGHVPAQFSSTKPEAVQWYLEAWNQGLGV